MIAKLSAVADLQLTALTLADELENQLRRADLFTRGVVACCSDLLQGHDLDGERTGIFIATAYGPMQCNLDVLDFLVEEEPLSPTLFSHSVFNGASGYLARIFNIHGPAITQTSYSYPFFTALTQAVFAIEQNHLTQAILIQAETYSTLLRDARPEDAHPWNNGAVGWLLGQTGTSIQNIDSQETPCSPDSRLNYTAISTTGTTHRHPLSIGLELNHLYRAGELPQTYKISSDFGTIALQFGQQP